MVCLTRDLRSLVFKKTCYSFYWPQWDETQRRIVQLGVEFPTCSKAVSCSDHYSTRLRTCVIIIRILSNYYYYYEKKSWNVFEKLAFISYLLQIYTDFFLKSFLKKQKNHKITYSIVHYLCKTKMKITDKILACHFTFWNTF